MKCHIFLPRCTALCPVSRPGVPKQEEKSLPPQSPDLCGLRGVSGDGTGLHSTLLLCPHGCDFVGLCEAPRHPPVQANNRALSHVLLISLLLCILCSLLFISHPHTATCVLWQITFGAVFTMAVATVLAETLAVILAFKAGKPGRTMRWLLGTGAAMSFKCAPWSRWLSVESGWEPLPLSLRWTHSEPKELLHHVQQGLGHCLLLCPGPPGLLSPGDLLLGFPGQEPAWHLQWNQVPDLQHAGAPQCLGHLPPRLPQHQGQGHGGCGDHLHLGLQCWAPRLHLCPKVLYYPPKTWELSVRFKVSNRF